VADVAAHYPDRKYLPTGTGQGLGLYICQQIIRQHGGHIWAQSDGEGRGTTFNVWLTSPPSHSN
jgi:signal transduction histidine kinase